MTTLSRRTDALVTRPGWLNPPDPCAPTLQKSDTSIKSSARLADCRTLEALSPSSVVNAGTAAVAGGPILPSAEAAECRTELLSSLNVPIKAAMIASVEGSILPRRARQDPARRGVHRQGRQVEPEQLRGSGPVRISTEESSSVPHRRRRSVPGSRREWRDAPRLCVDFADVRAATRMVENGGAIIPH